MINTKRNFGFSLIEAIVAIGILVILAAGSLGFYRNYSKNFELESFVDSITSDLKSVQSKSINGEDDLKWGVHLVNGTEDYYETFNTSTDYGSGSVKTTIYLPGGITFSEPMEGVNKDIIYAKIYGTIASDTTVKIVSGDTEKTINITALGNIY